MTPPPPRFRPPVGMPSATVTERGQVTLPKEIREALKVKAGDRVAFRRGGHGQIVVEAETVDLFSLFGILKPRRKGLTVEAINDVVRRRPSPG